MMTRNRKATIKMRDFRGTNVLISSAHLRSDVFCLLLGELRDRIDPVTKMRFIKDSSLLSVLTFQLLVPTPTITSALPGPSLHPILLTENLTLTLPQTLQTLWVPTSAKKEISQH